MNEDHIKRLQQISTCDISDTLVKMRISPGGGLLPGIKMYSPHFEAGDTRIVGPAFTVLMTSASDKTSPTPAQQFVDASTPGSVIVLQIPRGLRSASWGGLMSIAAQVKGVQGAVIDGGCRDLNESREMGFPVFAKYHSTLGQVSFVRLAALNTPLTFRTSKQEGDVEWPDTVVNPGDIMVCDVDGCVAIPADRVNEVIEQAERGAAVDARIAEALRGGAGVAESVKKYR